MKNLLIITVALLLCGNLFSQNMGVTIPVTEDYKYDAPRTNYHAVSYTAFHSTDADEYSFVFNTFSQPYKYFRGGSGNFGYASAPLNLPDGVIVTNLTAYVLDNASTEFLRVNLIQTPYGSFNITKATLESTDVFASSSVQEISTGTLNVPIDNAANSYQLRFTSSDNSISTIRLYGIRIEYTTERAQ